MNRSYLKRSAKPMKRTAFANGKKLPAVGKSRRSRERREWARELAESLKHIEFCEKCGATGVILDIAHRLKRRFITTRAEYFMAAKLCRFGCHRGYDEATGEDVHRKMFDGITQLIEKRNKGANLCQT